MSADNNNRLDTSRIPGIVQGALLLQLVLAIVAGFFAGYSGGLALWSLTAQLAISVLFWFGTRMQITLRLKSQQEAIDRERAEQKRLSQGLESLFDIEDEGPAERNWRQWHQYFAPALGFLIGLSLFAPLGYLIFAPEAGIQATWQAEVELTRPLVAAAFLMIGAFATLSIGMYVGGLSRVKNFSVLRAGAGAMLQSTVFMAAVAVALGLGSKGWLWLDKLCAFAIPAILALQGLEVLLNQMLDFYRPRTPGVESRPAFDSRLSGWLAEPQNIYQSIASTLDYQFGFKVSDTWFYQFLEKAFVPLILIQILAFYLLSCFVVVQPGQVAIIERFGAPRGIRQLPTNSADWDKLQAPLPSGLQWKLPWPFERAKIIQTSTITTLKFGYEAKNEDEYKAKADLLTGKIVTWDIKHVEAEQHYILPLPGEQQQGFKDTANPQDQPQRNKQQNIDTMLLSVYATLEYRVGQKRPGDVYRYAYLHQDAQASARQLFEAKLTQYFAGANFWDILVDNPEKVEKELAALFQQAANQQQLGIDIVNFQLEEVHPPVGTVGRAYQEVLAAREARQARIYQGERDAISISGAIPARVNEVKANAQRAGYRRKVVTQARAQAFSKRHFLFNTAPDIFLQRLKDETLDSALTRSRVLFLPKDLHLRLDKSQVFDALGSAIDQGIQQARENEAYSDPQ